MLRVGAPRGGGVRGWGRGLGDEWGGTADASQRRRYEGGGRLATGTRPSPLVREGKLVTPLELHQGQVIGSAAVARASGFRWLSGGIESTLTFDYNE